jgi:hypothetical protein
MGSTPHRLTPSRFPPQWRPCVRGSSRRQPWPRTGDIASVRRSSSGDKRSSGPPPPCPGHPGWSSAPRTPLSATGRRVGSRLAPWRLGQSWRPASGPAERKQTVRRLVPTPAPPLRRLRGAGSLINATRLRQRPWGGWSPAPVASKRPWGSRRQGGAGRRGRHAQRA